jgi:CRISPR/Cas system Type II protein with McrA/HNH and RuvC-like nuclease domain
LLKRKCKEFDFDITLETLYKRDNGVCYLCGEVCDWSDHEWRDGNHYTGNKYPTIDHVVPLMLGGSHTWENIRLACFKCNTEKGATTPTFTKEMAREEARKFARERCTNRKKTAQYTKDGKLIRIWDSTAQIKRELGLNDKHIQSVCRGYKSNTGNAYGFHWEYIVEHEDSKLKASGGG